MVSAKALKNVDISEEIAGFSSVLVRDGGVYISTRETPLLVQTPALVFDADLTEDDTFVNIRPKNTTFFKEVENAVLALALVNKGSWFREDIADDLITNSLRSFVEDDTVRVRVSEGFVAFDVNKTRIPFPVAAGVRVKAVLELERITFSKTQFGAVWNLKQVRLVEDSRYLFDEDVVEGLAEEMNESILLAETDEELVSTIE